MFKSVSLISAAMLAAASMASPAAAQQLSPAPGTVTLTGILELQQSTTIQCTVTVVVSIDAAGVGTVTSATFAPPVSPLCGTIVTPANLPWTVTAINMNQVQISGIGARSILGNCSGTVVADVTQSGTTGTLNFSNEVIPGTPNDCTIVEGTLSGTFDIVP